MHATTVKNKITQRDNYKEIMSVIVVILLLTLTLIAIFSAIDQLGISEMGRIARDLTPVFYTNLPAHEPPE
ncbi:two-component system connector SafA, partial [Escherichia coli]|uniref:two-component system connector SafA n=2 Tax=Escherichia coli TaxID=562 RepID=UPI000B3F54E7